MNFMLSTLARARGPIARASIISFFVRLAGVALSFTQAILTARLLGPTGYGLVAMAFSIAQVGATAIQLGLGPLAVRTVSRYLAAGDTASVRSFVSKALLTVAALSLISMGLPTSILLFSDGKLIPLDMVLLLGCIATGPLAFILLLRGIAQGLGHIALAQWPGELLRPGILIAIMLCIAVSSLAFGPVAFLMAMILSATLAALVASFATLRLIRALPDATLRDRAKIPGLKVALPFLGIGLVAILQGEMATLMLGSLATVEQAGLFQPVARIAPLIALPMNAVAMSYTPRFATLWQQNERARAIQATYTFTLITFAAGLSIFLGIYLFAPLILRLFGSQFETVTPLLRILAAGQLFVAACGPAGAIITMIGRSRDALWALIVGLMLQVLLGTFLIPGDGARGAVISVTVGTAMTWLLMLFAARKAGGFDPSLITAATRLRGLLWSFMDR